MVLLFQVKGKSPQILNTKDPKTSSLTDVFLWKLENEKLQNKYSGLQWKFGDTIWGTAESFENLHDSKCGKRWFGLVECPVPYSWAILKTYPFSIL